MTPEELAQEGYHAYGSVTDWKNYQGDPMPLWTQLPEKIQLAWCAFATRVAVSLDAKDGYQAYGDSTGWVNFQGKQMPTWENLTPTITQAWQAATKRISELV